MKLGLGFALLGAALWLAAPRPAAADWPPFGQAICTAPNGQTHAAITTDGAGGAIVCWQDHRGAKVNVFTQHVLASGDVDPAWPFNGRAMLNDTSLAGAAGGPFAPLIVSDGAGGAIVAWADLRDVASNRLDLFTQHVLASGALDGAWPANGTGLAFAVGLENSMVMTSDGAGGAILTWVDSRAGVGQLDLYAHHVLGTGVVDPRWDPNGIAVCTAPGSQEFPAIVTDGAGGAIIAWDDPRNGATNADVFAQHVLNSGGVDPGWPANGRALCTATGGQGRATIASDGAHGAIVAWSDGRVDSTFHIFAEHVLASGVIDAAWPLNGRAVSNAGPLEGRPLAISDDTGGAIINWQALNVHLNMFAQHVTAAGVVDPAWPAGGRALSITKRQQTDAEIVPDGAKGAIVAWVDSSDVFAQHVFASGALDPAYPDTGRAISNLPNEEGDVALVATGAGGAIVAWTAGRDTSTDADIFAMQVLEAQTVDVSGPPGIGITFDRPNPNPARGNLTLRFTLPRAAPVTLAIYDVAGRRVRELSRGEQAAGEHGVSWDLRDSSGHTVGAGVYFARLDALGHSLHQKVVAME